MTKFQIITLLTIVVCIVLAISYAFEKRWTEAGGIVILTGTLLILRKY